jgi:hypothetical protein
MFLRAGKAPPDLRVKGSFELRDADLSALPPDMSVAGNLVLQNLPQLRSLPSGLHVAGTLVLDYCERLESIPSTVCIDGGLWINDCDSITELPRSSVEFCTEIEIAHCANFRTLPENTTYHNGPVTLLHCKSLTTLPNNMTVCGRLRANHCVNLKTIPATLCVKRRSPEPMRTKSWIELLFGKLTITSYSPPSVEWIRHVPHESFGLDSPNGNWKGAFWNASAGNLDLEGCSSLSEIPDGVQVEGHIEIAGTQIRSLPPSLSKNQIYWRGQFTDWSIVHPETLTAERILFEPNAHLRRMMLERFPGGLKRLISDTNAEILDSDYDAGGERKLLFLPLPGDEPLVCLQVQCPSTAAIYILRVPPDTRTCVQAAAWIAGYDDPEKYNPVVET